MQLSISGHHVDVTEAMRNYAQDKFQRLERHYDHITNAHIVLSVEKMRQRAEATLHVSGAELFADADSADLYAAIDLLIDKLDRQLIRHKEKVIGRHQGRG
jgi:putative sigma-54 modulation protein